MGIASIKTINISQFLYQKNKLAIGTKGECFITLGGMDLGELKSYIIEMDKEWLTLIIEAKKMGLEKEEVRDFLRRKKLLSNQ